MNLVVSYFVASFGFMKGGYCLLSFSLSMKGAYVDVNGAYVEHWRF
jgi:hypothetical protein